MFGGATFGVSRGLGQNNEYVCLLCQMCTVRSVIWSGKNTLNVIIFRAVSTTLSAELTLA